MEQKDKELLLKDLSARLLYGVLLRINKVVIERLHIIQNHRHTANWFINGFNIDAYEVKPYLRPMSSMTEEEKETYNNLCYEEEREEYELGEWVTRVYYHDMIDSIDYLNSIHVDYRGLIPKGLAIEVNKDNNPYK